MTLKNIFKLLPMAGLVLTLGLSSCIKDLDVDPIDPNLTKEFKQDEVFAKIYATLALSGQRGPDGSGDVAGIDEGTSGFYRLIWNLNELPSDEALCAWMGDGGIPELNFGSWTASNPQVNGMYYRLYFDITLINHFLEQTEGLHDAKTVKQRAEARFMRALNYYYLIDFFGNVPFSEQSVRNTPPERIVRADLYNYLIKELTEIEEDMFAPKTAPYGRADRAANWLLKSRILLNAEVYTGTPQWSEAAKYAKLVMESPYKLVSNYRYLFMGDNDGEILPPKGNAPAVARVNFASDEIILPISAHRDFTRSWTTSGFMIAACTVGGMPYNGLVGNAWAGNRARKALIEKFFDKGIPSNADMNDLSKLGDVRALFYANERTLEIEDPSNFLEGFSSIKYTNLRADNQTVPSENNVDTDVPFLRAAEAYLTFAEATLRAGGNASEALEAFNTIRERAKAKTYTSINIDDVLDEKAREFYFEAQRRTDLIRYGYFGGNSSYTYDWKDGNRLGGSFDAKYNLYPIPSNDLIANPNLIQNPGF